VPWQCHDSQSCDDKKVGDGGPYQPYAGARSPKMAAVSYRVNCGLAAVPRERTNLTVFLRRIGSVRCYRQNPHIKFKLPMLRNSAAVSASVGTALFQRWSRNARYSQNGCVRATQEAAESQRQPIPQDALDVSSFIQKQPRPAFSNQYQRF
jgi:hypothetical protein